MNTKKILVAALFILTIVIGVFAVYLTISVNTPKELTPTPTVTITPTAAAIPTTTPSGSIAVTPPPTGSPAAAGSCGEPCGTGLCNTGNSCLNVNGIKRCVANICLSSQTPPVVNTSCKSDLCTALDNIEITKIATLRCQGTSKTRIMNVSIKITNPSNIVIARSNLKVVDSLGNPSLVSYFNTGSANNGGQVVGTDNSVTWNNLSLKAGGDSQELHYTMSLPNSESGKSYTNKVSVYENGVLKGSATYTVNVDILPCTALTTNATLIIVAGALLIMLGMLSFRLHWNEAMGQFFWNHGLAGFSKIIRRNFKMSAEDRFESDLLGKRTVTKHE